MHVLLRLFPPASRELLARYVTEAATSWFQILGGLLALGVVFAATRWLSRRLGSKLVQGLLIAIAAAAAVMAAWQVKWVADDAFISFRYAENFVHGKGLVWNPGERVEGYTNFLWTMLVALGMVLRADPVQTATVLGLASFAALVAVVFRWTLRLLPEDRRAFALLPLGLTAANAYLVSYGTSGLETMFVTLMVACALERATAGSPRLAGLAGAAAMMAHPDQAILIGALAVALFVDRDRRREAVRFAATVALVFGPYYLLRWWYYGEFWTNTYYAKSASSAYFAQGLTYLGIGLLSGGLWGLLPAVLAGIVLPETGKRAAVLRVFAAVGFPLFVLYIAKIGGDFMDGRLVTSLLPPAFVLATLAIAHAWPRKQPIAATSRAGRVARTLAAAAPPFVLAALTLSAGLRLPILRPGEKLSNIADEGSFYRLASFSPPVVANGYFEQGRTLGEAFTNKTVKMAAGCVGMVGYYSKLPMLDQFGLNDKVTARMPIATRARPGHEKLARIPRLLEWGADFSVDPMYPWPYTETGRVDIAGFPYYIIRYNKAAAAELAARGLFAPEAFRERLAAWVDPASAPQRTAEDAACHAWYVDTIYLTSTPDPGLHETVETFLKRALPGVGEQVALSFEAANPAQRGYTLVKAWDMAEFHASNGKSYVLPPGGMIAGQGRVWGAKGSFIDTYTKDGDADVVTLTAPRFRLEGDALTLAVGGGRSLREVFVGLRVNGQWVRQATGCEVEAMGRRVWDVSGLAGQEAELVVVDGSAGGWGHLEVGDVALWRAPAAAAGAP